MLALSLLGKLPAASHGITPAAAAAMLLCRAHGLCLSGTAAWPEFQPSVPLHQSRDVLRGWAAQLGPAGSLRWVRRHRSAVRAQPDFSASLMEVCPSESQRIAPKLLEVVQDTAAFHRHNVQALGFY